jgi:aminoglycoside 2''-phosphotransferase
VSKQWARTEMAPAFPDLPVRHIAFLGAGVDSEAYLVNDEWVFRFPKREAAARALDREVALLPKLAGRLPVAVPRFTYLGHQSGSGLLFAGYRLIPGEPLTAELFSCLAFSDQERVLATLADFLRSAHSFPVGEAAAAGVAELYSRDWVEACWAGGQALVLPLLAPRAGAALVRLIEGFLGDAQNFAYTPCLLYADFAPEHVLYDAAARAIVGIIDWGDLAIGDPDYDLLYLRQDYGEEFVHRLLGHYPHPEPARLLEKQRVFNACDHINTIVSARGDPAELEAIQESVAALGEIVERG